MIDIYTDGACSMKNNRQGSAFVIYQDGKPVAYHSCMFTDGTNQTAEVLAVINAFRYIIHNNVEKARIITDSMYVVGTTIKGWGIKANQELWNTYFYFYNQIKERLEFQHVRGHQGIEGNELCDVLAVIACNSI